MTRVIVRITIEKEYSDNSHWQQGRQSIINAITSAGWSYKIHTEE